MIREMIRYECLSKELCAHRKTGSCNRRSGKGGSFRLAFQAALALGVELFCQVLVHSSDLSDDLRKLRQREERKDAAPYLVMNDHTNESAQALWQYMLRARTCRHV